jgi:DNA-binding IclR family transcriptional regulator
MASSNAKQALFEAIALMGKAFSSPRRLELLDLLAQAPRSVEDIAQASGQSTANASQHLQALHAAGMVTRTRAPPTSWAARAAARWRSSTPTPI